MSKQPFLPLFFGDLLASTAAWCGEERALYILLLAYQWTSGPLPADPKRLARMCQYEAKAFSKLWPVISPKFQPTEAGLVNARLEEHREKSERLSKQNEERARNAASKRWSNAPSNAPSIATPDAIHPIPSHPRVLQPSSLGPDVSASTAPERARAPENREVPRETGSMDLALLLVPGADPEAVREWQAHRSANDRPLREHEIIAIGKTLAGFGTAEIQRATVRNCIGNGWRNLRPSDAAAVTVAPIPVQRWTPPDDEEVQRASA